MGIKAALRLVVRLLRTVPHVVVYVSAILHKFYPMKLPFASRSLRTDVIRMLLGASSASSVRVLVVDVHIVLPTSAEDIGRYVHTTGFCKLGTTGFCKLGTTGFCKLTRTTGFCKMTKTTGFCNLSRRGPPGFAIFPIFCRVQGANCPRRI